MKILLLCDPNSSHSIKWKNSLIAKGIKVKVWGFDYSKPKLFQVKSMMNVIKKYKPDILHAHYASSYGLLGALSGFHPFILSVWGSDIFDFPKKSFINKYIIKFNLSKADRVLSTSHIMAKETKLYTNKNIEVTPFGIDTNIFKPTLNKNKIITVGVIKSLKNIYGIDYVIRAFSLVVLDNKDKPLKLLVVGAGVEEANLKNLVLELNLMEYVDFIGKIEYDKVVEYHNQIDIFLNISLQESFGVSVLESSSCEKPVIVSNVGGLPEVVQDEITGLIVPSKNYKETAKAINRLLLDKELRIMMGKKGREMVKSKYNWNDNVKQMIYIYKDVLN